MTKDGYPKLGPTMRMFGWEDPVMERMGVDVRSRYVERFWLPIIGPSATFLLRHVAHTLGDLPIRDYPFGLEVDTDELARALGLGGHEGRHAPLPRAVNRLCRYGLARHVDAGGVAFRRRVGPLSGRMVSRLPDPLRAAHDTIGDVLEAVS